MIIIIPLGGIGKRFSELGYKDPKPLVKVLGKEIIFWVLDNLKINNKDKVYIVYNRELDNFDFTDHFGKYPYLNFLKLNRSTSGPVETIYEITKIIEKNNGNEGVLIIDGDTFYKKNIIKVIKKDRHTIFYHKTKIKEPIFSYIKIKNKKILDIAEKKKISSNANTGAYYFNNIRKFNYYANYCLKKNKKTFVSEIYNKLIENKEKIYAENLKNSEFACLGTPKQIIDFSKQKKIEKKRFCFDLDNTLVTFPKILNDYTTVKPKIKNIKFLNFLHSLGHHIIIFTARRMKTHKGDIKKVKKDIEQLTIKQLKSFKIKYDELIFGKPYAHFYIDDLSINPTENLNIKLGYYETSDNMTRKFNEIIVGEKITIKNSKNFKILNNEINFLKNIPKKIKNLFPKLNTYGKNFYKMDTIKGLKLSYLLVNNLLTNDDLTNIYENLCIIHSSKAKMRNNKLNIYENYYKKLRVRLNEDQHVIKKFGSINFDKLNNYLIKYEKFDKGKIGLIHGDPVLSNIIKKTNDDLIFLDPRGSLGDQFTVYGDINYDFSKVYQSLYGYENIILDKKINYNYLEDLRNHFENLLISNNKIDNILTLKYLTSSLYFSLINFHDKKYTNKFLDIARNLI
tara:strand:+ start:149 stop:2017 length:1869 start_codon:yes stop_codon:yes gene_type:complete